MITDITERKRLEEQLRHTQKLESLGVLAGGVAHDFNNLLTGILGNASLAIGSRFAVQPDARLPGKRDVPAASAPRTLRGSCWLMPARAASSLRTIDLSELVREIGGLLQTSIPKTVQLRLDLQAEPASDRGRREPDPAARDEPHHQRRRGHRRQAGGTVLVTTGVQNVDEHYIRTVFAEHEIKPGKYVYLEVNDTGCGMDAETIARIFDPFFTTKFTGRGLGLAAASGIVRGHRGAIKVYSSPGKGSTFKVLFPVARRGEPPRSGRRNRGPFRHRGDPGGGRRAHRSPDRQGFAAALRLHRADWRKTASRRWICSAK